MNPSPATKDELLLAMTGERAGWLELLARVPADAMEEPNVDGVWSVKDVLAHITAFEQYAAALLADRKTGAGDQTSTLDAYYQQHLIMYRTKHPDFPDELNKVKGDQINELFVASFRWKTPTEVLEMEARAYQSMVDHLAPYTDEELTEPFTSTGKTLAEVIANQCYGHYQLHAPTIERWLMERVAK